MNEPSEGKRPAGFWVSFRWSALMLLGSLVVGVLSIWVLRWLGFMD